MAVSTSDKPIMSDIPNIRNFTTTSDSYTLVYQWNTALMANHKFAFEALTNDITVKLIYSLDGITFEAVPIVPEFSVGVGTPVLQSLALYSTKLQIWAKPTTPASHGTLIIRAAGSNLRTGLMYGKGPNANVPLKVDADGVLDVNTTITLGDVTVSTDALLHDGAGTAITSTTTSAKQRLDVADGGGSLTVDGPLTNAELTSQALATQATVASIDGNIVYCNTGDIAGSVSLTGTLPDTAASDLAHIHAKVDNIPTISDGKMPVVMAVLPDTAATDLAHIHAKVDNITACNTGAVTVAASALPTGASTSDAQTTGNSSLSSIDGKITAVNTGAVTVASSALPTGASTSSAQTTGNNSLSSIDGKIVACNTGAVAGTVSVTNLTACNTGAVTIAASALPSGASTSAAQTTGNNSLSSIDGKITACNTGSVTVASSALPTGSATSALQTTLNGYWTASVDATTGHLAIIPTEHAEIHDGDTFIVTGTTGSLSINGTFVILVTTPNTTKWAHFQTNTVSTNADHTVTFYEAPTASVAGAATTAYNKQRNSLNTATTVVTTTPTTSNNGTLLTTKRAGTGRNSMDNGQSFDEFVLKQNTKYLIILTSNGNSNFINWQCVWYEHTNP